MVHNGVQGTTYCLNENQETPYTKVKGRYLKGWSCRVFDSKTWNAHLDIYLDHELITCISCIEEYWYGP